MYIDIDDGMWGLEGKYFYCAVTRDGGWFHVRGDRFDHGLIWQWWPLRVKPAWQATPTAQQPTLYTMVRFD
jgi:hypothetical protein